MSISPPSKKKKKKKKGLLLCNFGFIHFAPIFFYSGGPRTRIESSSFSLFSTFLFFHIIPNQKTLVHSSLSFLCLDPIKYCNPAVFRQKKIKYCNQSYKSVAKPIINFDECWIVGATVIGICRFGMSIDSWVDPYIITGEMSFSKIIKWYHPCHQRRSHGFNRNGQIQWVTGTRPNPKLSSTIRYVWVKKIGLGLGKNLNF